VQINEPALTFNAAPRYSKTACGTEFYSIYATNFPTVTIHSATGILTYWCIDEAHAGQSFYIVVVLTALGLDL
jgi:hypothetical protein